MNGSAAEKTSPSGVSGVRVVLAIVGALAVLIALVLMGFALFEPESAPCAEGELADNPRLPDGTYEPRSETFDSVEDAEAFICHGVPELQSDGWRLALITAERTVPLDLLVEGRGLGVVSLGYEAEGGRALTIDASPVNGASHFESDIPSNATREAVTIGGVEGTAYRFGINPDFVTVVWREGDLDHRATANLTQDFQLPDLLTVLGTLE